MTTLMGQSLTLYADDLKQAETLVEQAKQEHGSNLQKHSVVKKNKGDIEFYIVTIVVSYYKIADLVITE